MPVLRAVQRAGQRPGRRSGRQKSGNPNPVDVQVGSRVRLRRNMLGLSQEKLGEALGLTFQQVQKYERGANRIGASRLHELSRVLDVPVSFFFDDTDPVRAPAIPAGFAEPPTEGFDSDPLRRRETVELVEAYYAIEDVSVRRRLLDLAKALAAEGEPAGEKPAPRSRKRSPRQDPA
ncbi:MAG: helix-turn-helix domain-containing protein [Thiohalocapsa sp.]